MIGLCFSEDQRANIIKRMFKRDWTTSSNIHNYYELNNECNWEDLYIKLRNRQTHTSDTITK